MWFYVKVTLYRRVLPEVTTSWTRVYRVMEPCAESAKAYGENKARKHKLTADGWMSDVRIISEADYSEYQAEEASLWLVGE